MVFLKSSLHWTFNYTKWQEGEQTVNIYPSYSTTSGLWKETESGPGKQTYNSTTENAQGRGPLVNAEMVWAQCKLYCSVEISATSGEC